MKNFFLVIIFFGIAIDLSYSQNILMEEDIRTYDLSPPEFGPNAKNYRHSYISYQLFVPTDTTIIDCTQPSSLFMYGIRYKRKLTKWFAIGYDVSYVNYSFAIKQNTNKFFPTKILHKKELVRANNVGLELYLRFNFGKRGNYIGKFIDIGAYGNFVFSKKHIFYDNMDSVQINIYHGKQQKVINKGVDYIKDYNYGVRIRAGIDKYIVVADYRISRLITGSFENTDFYLPKLSIGIQIGMY